MPLILYFDWEVDSTGTVYRFYCTLVFRLEKNYENSQ